MQKTISRDQFIREQLVVFVGVFVAVFLISMIGQAALPYFAVMSASELLIKGLLFAANAAALHAAVNIVLRRI